MLDELSHRLRRLTEKRGNLLRQLAALDVEINDVKAKHHSLFNQSAPFFRLPPELIVLIFEICHNSSPSFELLASHVCVRWRDIVLNLPHFWNTIDLVFPPHHQSAPILQKLALYLSRSNPLLIDVFISCDLIDSALNLLIPHASRWRRLCLVTSSPTTSSIHHALHHLPVPALEYLSLRTPHGQDPGSRPYINFPSLLPQILSSTSSLAFVRLVGAALWSLQPSLTTVRTLHLEGCKSMYMTPQQFRTLMATLPCLVNLSLDQLYIDAFEDGRNPTLTTLQRLRVCEQDRQAGIIFSLLYLPNLETLCLRNVESFDSISRPSLQSIAFEACPLSPNELWNIAHVFPSISSLTMDQSVEALYSLLRFTSGHVKWPNLKMITIYDLIPVNVQVFCDMIQDRIKAGRPLACVRLNRRSRNVLRSKGLLPWLCERVKMENHDFEERWPPGLGFHDPDDT